MEVRFTLGWGILVSLYGPSIGFGCLIILKIPGSTAQSKRCEHASIGCNYASTEIHKDPIGPKTLFEVAGGSTAQKSWVFRASGRSRGEGMVAMTRHLACAVSLARVYHGPIRPMAQISLDFLGFSTLHQHRPQIA